jgi:hypothetical protein
MMAELMGMGQRVMKMNPKISEMISQSYAAALAKRVTSQKIVILQKGNELGEILFVTTMMSTRTLMITCGRISFRISLLSNARVDSETSTK